MHLSSLAVPLATLYFLQGVGFTDGCFSSWHRWFPGKVPVKNDEPVSTQPVSETTAATIPKVPEPLQAAPPDPAPIVTVPIVQTPPPPPVTVDVAPPQVEPPQIVTQPMLSQPISPAVDTTQLQSAITSALLGPQPIDSSSTSQSTETKPPELEMFGGRPLGPFIGPFTTSQQVEPQQIVTQPESSQPVSPAVDTTQSAVAPPPLGPQPLGPQPLGPQPLGPQPLTSDSTSQSMKPNLPTLLPFGGRPLGPFIRPFGQPQQVPVEAPVSPPSQPSAPPAKVEPIELNKLDLLKAKIESAKETNQLVMVYFWSTDCAPCKNMVPKVLQEVAADLEGVMFLKVNGDRCFNCVMQFNVQTYPSFYFIKNGVVLADIRGITPGVTVNQIKEYIKKFK